MIYVYIPSRLDRELIPTCYDIVAKASKPQDLHIVVFNQDRAGDTFFQEQFPEQVLLVNVDYNKFSNICYVRSLANAFIEPEDKYFLGIDSHMRFDQDWDKILIDNLPEKSVLSAYPPPYSKYGETFPTNNQHFTNGFSSDPKRKFPFVSKILPREQDYEKSTFSGGFHFSSIKWLTDVGYDKNLCWKWEEIDLTYRTIAAGYNIVNYKHTPLYHLYEKIDSRKIEDHQEKFLTNCDEAFERKLNSKDIESINNYYDIDFFKFIVGMLN
tara:strand:+ start:1716 stop:2522 length:807 start_codon:yes stop_codon:yes gene_type:complete